MRLTDLMALYHVPRWGIVSISRPQSVAEHTFGVQVIYQEFCRQLRMPVESNALVYIMMHDGPESRTGDIPGWFKRYLDRPNLTAAEGTVCPWYRDTLPVLDRNTVDLIKLCDLIETYTYVDKYGIGTHAKTVAIRVDEEVRDLAQRLGPEIASVSRDIVMSIQSDRGRP